MTETQRKEINNYGDWIREKFAYKVQKISIDAGFSCPNRDGKKGTGGCIFCDNNTFNPSYCDPKLTIKEQLREGKDFFARKYKDMKYIAYFQAYSNTYAPLDTLKRRYEEALDDSDVVGIAIGTRPDCINEEILDYLEHLNRQTFVTVEYGIESANDDTLRLINRGHDFECSRKAVEQTAARGITTGAHVIHGLPGEDKNEILRQAEKISALPLTLLKIHQMQIIKGTRLAKMFAETPFPLFSAQEYISLVAEYLQRIRYGIVIERVASQSPKNLLIAPDWGLKNYQLTNLLINYMKEKGIKQGDKAFEAPP